MRSFEIVFDKPLGQLPVEDRAIRRQVPHGNELILEGTIEPFVERIVSRGLGT